MGLLYKLVTYICNTYANYGKEVCSSHSILQRIIEGLVLEDIRARAKRVIEDEDGERFWFHALDKTAEALGIKERPAGENGDAPRA